MNKLFSVLMIAVLPGLAIGNGAPNQAAQDKDRAETKAVVSVVALSPGQAEALARVRSEYKARKSALDTEYEALMNELLTSSPTDNS